MEEKTILFLIADAHGHVNALMSTLHELQQRKRHKIVVLMLRHCTPGEKLKEQGFQVEYLEETQTEEVHSGLFADMNRFEQGSFRSFEFVTDTLLEWYLKLNSNYDEFKKKLDSFNYNAIIIDHVLLSPCMLNSKRPWIRFYSIFPSYLYARYNPKRLVAGLGLPLSEMTEETNDKLRSILEKLSSPVRKFYVEKGAPDWETDEYFVEPVSPHLNFYLGPRELGYENSLPDIKVPPGDICIRLEHTIDSAEVGQQEEFEIPERLLKLPGKLIYFSMGTVASFIVDLMNRLLAHLAHSPHKFIVSMGEHHEKVKLYPNMWGAKRVNQKAVLQKVDLFITHGGHNSTIEAFYFGIPFVIMPCVADQYDVAQQVVECGFARKLDPYKCSQNELLEAIESALIDKETSERLKTISQRMRSVDYHKICADKIEHLVDNSVS